MIALGRWVGVEMGEEDAHVFETGVHALSVEGNHGVSGVAEDYGRGGGVVRVAFHADEREVGVAGEGGDEGSRWDERCYAGEMGVEECGKALGGGFEGGEVGRGEEEGACE